MTFARTPPLYRAAYRPRKCAEPATNRVRALAHLDLGLRDIAACPGMPMLDTLMRWIDEEESFRTCYERARVTQSELFADDALSLADALSDGDFAGVKLRVDARKWHVMLRRKGTNVATTESGQVDDDVIRRLEAAGERLAQLDTSEVEAPDAAKDVAS